MKNYKVRYALIFTVAVLACTIFLFYIEGRSNNFKVFEEKSPDQKYTVEVYQTDYAQKPNGSVPFKVSLIEDERGKEIAFYENSLYIDGRLLTSQMIDAQWSNEGVVIVVDMAAGRNGKITLTYSGDGYAVYVG